jgi:hypothetical protein
MRKRATIFATLLTVALVAGACGNGDRDVSVDTDRAPPELLYLGSHGAITAVSPRSGAIRFQQAGAVPSRDWSVLYAATNDGTSTTLRTLDPVTGAELASRTVPGVFTVRVVSEDGAAVALAPPMPDGFDTYHPPSKDPTPLVIVRRGDPSPQVLSVAGNVEPEAFSLAGDALFVIDFVPPLAPERYRVARLDLELGTVGDVRNYEQELQEPMRGNAHAQVMAPDGRHLYTLYTRDATPTEPAKAFVHVLDLEQQLASCVDLPPTFAISPLGALAVSPSGNRLYVSAPAAGAFAELAIHTLPVTRTAEGPPGSAGTTARATTSSTTLYVAVDQAVSALSLDDLQVERSWIASGTVIGLKPSTDGSVLYVSLADRVLVLDPRTLTPRTELDVTTTEPIDHVAPALPPIPDAGYVKCAC